jgi:molybdopterin converting factor small subunit
MAVVRLRAPLKQLAGGPEQALPGATVGDVLVALEEANPAIKGWVLDERGILRPHINVFVNGEQEAQDTIVGDEDRVDVLPALSGG